jgi:hypothetical protein
MSDGLLEILNVGFLGLLYLFFARVLWAAWSEVRGPRAGLPQRRQQAAVPAVQPPAGDATAPVHHPVVAAAGGQGKPPRGRRGAVARLVVLEPKVRKGAAFALGAEITIGRGSECSISIPDDHFVSQLHARVYRQDGAAVVDDLGSTNGTFLNGQRVGGPRPLDKGDRLQIGNTVLEAQ